MKKITAYLIKEATFWYTAPFVFLAIYIGHYHNPLITINEHLYVITLIALIALLLKICLYRLIKIQPVALILSAAVYATVLLFLIIYYLLVIIGLESWGRVITEELIVSYTGQIRQLFEAIGISFLIVISLVISGYLIIFSVCYFTLKRYWAIPQFHTNTVKPILISAIFLSLIVLFTYKLIHAFSYSFSKEPIYLSLFSGKPTNSPIKNMHKIHINKYLDLQEENERAKYKITNNANRKNVILIIVDALRHDHMGIYGYQRETTPFLSSIEKQGLLTKINNVRATCSESACGLASIASSKYSHQLPTNPLTLHEILQRYDYSVNLILSGDHTNFYNLRESYGKVDSYFDGSMAKGHYMNDDLLVINHAKSLPEWKGAPTLFQFHLMSAHPLGKRLSHYEQFTPHKSYTGITTGPPKIEHSNHYDNGVLQADAIIQDLLNILNRKNYLKNALVVITADHGESLGEHQIFSHANSVKEEVLRLPLLLLNFSDKVKKQLRYNNFVSQVDIAPTILHELNIPPPDSWSGHPIQLIEQFAKDRKFSFFQLIPYVGLYDHRNPNQCLKYWHDINTDEEFAYDIRNDPMEHNNLISQLQFVSLQQRKEWRELANATRTQ